MEKIGHLRKMNNLERHRFKSDSFCGESAREMQKLGSKKLGFLEKKTTERKVYKFETTDDDDNDDTLSDCSERLGLCVTCNLAIVETSDIYGKKLLQCHRCIKRLNSQTDTSFMVCQSDSQNSGRSDYCQDSSDCYIDQLKLYSTRTYNISDQLSKSDFHNPTNYYNQSSRLDFHRGNQNLSKMNIQENGHPNYHYLSKNEDLLYSSSENKINMQTLECSRRPIRCPRVDCAMNVAFSALTHHFLFDHPEVPVISVNPDMKSTVVFGYSSIACDSSRCLALLLVSDKLSQSVARLFNGSQIHTKYRNRLPLPVLAARLRRKSLYNNIEGGDIYGEDDVIIIWIAGLDMGNSKNWSLRCSIQAVDNIESNGIRSLTYTGPINSLRTAQSPRQVLLTGDCLILHEGFVKSVTSDNDNLNVNLVVH